MGWQGEAEAPIEEALAASDEGALPEVSDEDLALLESGLGDEEVV